MKNLKYIVVLLLVIGLGYVAYKNWGKVPPPTEKKDIAADVGTDRVDICYIYNTEAGDKAALHLITSDGINVTGSFNYTPAQKDKKTGAIVGTVGEYNEVLAAQKADFLWTASGEGVTNTEQLWILLGDGNARVGFGEMKLDPKTKQYVYANSDKVTYSMTLQQASCDDPAMK